MLIQQVKTVNDKSYAEAAKGAQGQRRVPNLKVIKIKPYVEFISTDKRW